MATERADLAATVAELRRLEAVATAMDASWAVADYLTALRIHAPALLDALAAATAERDRLRLERALILKHCPIDEQDIAMAYALEGLDVPDTSLVPDGAADSRAKSAS